MTEAVLRFPGQVPDFRPDVIPGGCEMGDRRCSQPPDLEVTVPSLGAARLLCRDHAGYYMLAATHAERVTRVMVRRLSAGESRNALRQAVMSDPTVA